MFWEKALTNKDNCVKDDNDGNYSSHSKGYTIFHALFEALKDKDKKHKKR